MLGRIDQEIQKEEDTHLSLQHRGGPNFLPVPGTDVSGLHLNLPSTLPHCPALGFSHFHRAVSASRSYYNPAQMPPPLGGLPWLNPLLLRMALSFPYTPTSHCRKSVSCSRSCPGVWWAAWGPCFLRAEVTPACRCSPSTSGLGESRGSECHSCWRWPWQGTGTAVVFSTPNQPLEHSRTNWQWLSHKSAFPHSFSRN